MSDCIHFGPGYKPSKKGYGYRYDYAAAPKRRYAHRESLEAKLGRSLGPGEMACHSCDNPSCVNVDHLFPGSHQDNVADMVKKLRHGVGSANGRAKMSEADVLRVLEMRKGGALYREIASHMGVTIGAISHIFNGRAWSHVRG